MRLLLLSILSLGSLFPFITSAQQIESPPTVLAQVRVQNCTFEQVEKNLLFACDFINAGTETVANIHYAFEFIRKGSQSVPVDTILSPDDFSLGGGRTYHKEWNISIPAYLEGDYNLILRAANPEGLPLAFNNLGSFTTKGTGALIQAETCNLTIEGKGDKQYTLTQGVDIALEENLIAKCQVTNQGETALNLTPSFTTHYRTIFGTIVPTQTYTPTTLTLNPKETKEYIFSLPKATMPQAYDIILTLTKDTIPLTNSVVFHYVIQGASATIQTLSLDKTGYQKGETATLTSFFTGSADFFPDSRSGGTEEYTTKLRATIKSNTTLCGETTEDVKQNKQTATLSLQIQASCVDPTVTLQILNGNNEVIAEKTITVPTDPQEGKITQSFTDKLIHNWLPALILFLIVLPLLVILIAKISKKQTRRFSLSLFLFLTGSLFLGVGEVRGDTFTGNDGVTYTTNINKSSYSPNEAMQWSARLQWTSCANSGVGYSLSVTNLPNPAQTYSVSTEPYVNVDCIISGGCEIMIDYDYLFTSSSFGPSFSAPNSSGSYAVRFIGGGVTRDMLYTVNGPAVNGSCGSTNNACTTGTLNDTTDDSANYLWDCNGSGGGTNANCSLPKPIDGVCGSSNGVATSSAPTSGFCGAGSASSVTGTGPWNWSCNGSNGGTNASCSAPLSGGGTPVVNGACGSSNGGSFSSAPSTNLCNAGATSWTDSTAGDNTYNWDCTGSGGGSNISCSATKTSTPPAGACGSANGVDAWSAPSSGLCSAGTASAVSGSGPWSWSCTGSTTAYCSAPKGPATPSLNLTVNGVAAIYNGIGATPSIDVAQGDNLNLVWSSQNTTSCQALSGPGWMTNPKAVSGNDNVAATVSSDYYLRCIGAAAASGGNYIADKKININVIKKLTVCKDSCSSGIRRGLGGTTTSATYTANATENWVACYGESQNCTGDPSTDVTTSTTWGENTSSSAATLTGTNPKVMTMGTGGNENMTASYNNNVSCSPFNSYYDWQQDFSSWPFTYHWVAGSGSGNGSIVDPFGKGTATLPNWTPAGIGFADPTDPYSPTITGPQYKTNGVTLLSAGGNYPMAPYGWRLICNQKSYNETATINVNATCTDAGACSRDSRSTSMCAGDAFTVTDSCGVTQTCTGSKSCDFNWKEVAPK